MGYGDQVLGTGLARGAAARGRRIAFGDGQRIIWNMGAAHVFANNPNIAWPGQEREHDVEWIPYYKGHRIYNRLNSARDRWIWNYDFDPVPGELYFTDAERKFAEKIEAGFVLIEPNLPWDKSCAPNKDWGQAKYQAVADALLKEGLRVVQFTQGRRRVKGVKETINAPDYRHALAALSRAALYFGPEGGLHHGSAAVGTKGVVIFGGFVTPKVTGYSMHRNLTGGVDACGSVFPCQHCKAAMEKISVEEALDAARERLAA